MNIEITIRAPELVQALQTFTEALISASMESGRRVSIKAEVKDEAETKAENKTVTTTTTPSTKEETTTISLSQIRAKFVEAAQKGKRDELKALLEEYGADNVSSLKPEVFEDVYARLEAI